MLVYKQGLKIREKAPQKQDTIEPVKRVQVVPIKRPEVVDAKVYKVKSPFAKFNVYITLSYIIEGSKKRPIEIFINSKDLTHSAEYAILTRLISAIFRRGGDPQFILEELRSIYDPNGGYFKEGKYIHSFYSEVADVIERFFKEEGIMTTVENTEQLSIPIHTSLDNTAKQSDQQMNLNNDFKICPECNCKTLKFENGCEFCVQCGYTKCDK